MENTIQSANTSLALNFKNKTLRIKGTSDNPEFCLIDVCNFLEIKNVSDANTRINKRFGEGVGQSYPLQTAGGMQQTTFIKEPAFYYLVMRSDKKEAIGFQSWVFSEVLPAIRKTGYYKNVQPLRVTPAQKLAIKKEINKIVACRSELYQKAWASVHNRFNVASYQDLNSEDYNDIVNFINNLKFDQPILQQVKTKETKQVKAEEAKSLQQPKQVEDKHCGGVELELIFNIEVTEDKFSEELKKMKQLTRPFDNLFLCVGHENDLFEIKIYKKLRLNFI